MNGNPFYVSPLGGLDLGQTVGGIYNAYSRRQEIDEQKALQEQQMQQQQARQAEMQDLAMRMQQGDIAAGQEFYSKYPERAAMVDKGMGVRDENQAKQIGGFFEKLIAIPDLQGKRDFLQKTAGQTPFTIDDDLLAMDDETLQNSINITAPRYLNKEQIGMLQGGGSGSTVAQKDFQYYQDLLQRDPEAAKAYGMSKGYVETGRDAAPTTAQRDWKEYQRLKKENPEEARQYGQAAGFVSKEGRELSSGLQKRLSEATDEAVKSSANVVKYNDLASQVDDANLQGGWAGQAGEVLKNVTGQQDFRSELRKDYYAIRGSEVVNNLPPGAASDADIAMAMAGFPDQNANGQQIASFLRGLAKINEFQKQYNEFKADYISENGTERNMLKAWKDKGVEYQTPQRTIGKYKVQEVN